MILDYEYYHMFVNGVSLSPHPHPIHLFSPIKGIKVIRKNILLVDDDPLVIISMLQFLCGKGYNVVATNSPEAVMASIDPDCYDVIITDYKMEPVNGIELIRFLRGSRGFSGKAILVSGFCHLNKTEMGDIGIDIFFEKPFEIQSIYKKIREWIG
jgi:CheY-like chemotaxis protein